MNRILFSALLILGLACVSKGASVLSDIQVSGDDIAKVVFQTSDPKKEKPSMTIRDNIIELLFSNTQLRDNEKKDLSSPHVLIRRISVYASDKGKVKAKIVINGSIEKIKDRLKLKKADMGIQLSIAYPYKSSPTLNLLKEEQAPIQSEVSNKSLTPLESKWGEIVAIMVIITCLVVGGVFFYRYLNKRGKFGGSRKYLIEQMSYCPIGSNGKIGVCLLKVGNEFLLIGVTPNQVNLLSRLSKLSHQYEEENNVSQ